MVVVETVTSKFKVGDRVIVRFRRFDGTEHCEPGTITRLWGKKPYAANVDEDNGGGIRARLEELGLINKTRHR